MFSIEKSQLSKVKKMSLILVSILKRVKEEFRENPTASISDSSPEAQTLFPIPLIYFYSMTRTRTAVSQGEESGSENSPDTVFYEVF